MMCYARPRVDGVAVVSVALRAIRTPRVRNLGVLWLVSVCICERCGTSVVLRMHARRWTAARSPEPDVASLRLRSSSRVIGVSTGAVLA